LKARIPGLTYANVIATLALFVALGGGAIAASTLGKNSVGPKQLKKNAVTTAKIKNKAVTGAKIKPGTITGTQINAATLGTVPSANLANSLTPPEGWHLVGSPGQPSFQSGWNNTPPGPINGETVGFFKDHDGVVHLKGIATGGEPSKPVFILPPGFRPAAGRVLVLPGLCGGCGGSPTGTLTIFGSSIPPPFTEGMVAMASATTIGLDGVTFRAES
jgi:hypothetical protein